ncbi:unnamed protein product [Priceomyces carsonii]|nr:unnamed protein product [Priceomyces carsonii]
MKLIKSAETKREVARNVSPKFN